MSKDWGPRRGLTTAGPQEGVRRRDPVGFSDPPGFPADGHLLASKRGSCVEAKRCRISRLARRSYSTPKAEVLRYLIQPGFRVGNSCRVWVHSRVYAGYCELSAQRLHQQRRKSHQQLLRGGQQGGACFCGTSAPSSYVEPPRLGDQARVQEPMGFRIPLTYTAVGIQATFQRRRCRDLKHIMVIPAAVGSVTWLQVLGCSRRLDHPRLDH
jgi:hypothetical protein